MTHAIHKSSKLKPIKTKEKQKKRKETYLKKKNTQFRTNHFYPRQNLSSIFKLLDKFYRQVHRIPFTASYPRSEKGNKNRGGAAPGINRRRC